jgi:NADH-quinone oxidoreductase subunit F
VLGSASVILLDEDTDMVWAATKMSRFFKHESCGKCTPCREGTYWMNKRMEAILRKEGRPEDVKLLLDIADQINGKCLCALGDFSTSPVVSSIKLFGSEYDAYTKPAAPAKAAPKAPAKAPAPAGD